MIKWTPIFAPHFLIFWLQVNVCFSQLRKVSSVYQLPLKILAYNWLSWFFTNPFQILLSSSKNKWVNFHHHHHHPRAPFLMYSHLQTSACVVTFIWNVLPHPMPTNLASLPTSGTSPSCQDCTQYFSCLNLNYSSKSSSTITSTRKLFLNPPYYKPVLPSLNVFVSDLADIGYSEREGFWLKDLEKEGWYNLG